MGTGTRKEEIHLEVPRDTYYLSAIRGLVLTACRRAGLGELEASTVEIAVDEACAAALRASRDLPGAADVPLTVSFRIDPRKLVFRVTDPARRWSFEDAASSEELPSGFGRLVISSFMDEVDLIHDEQGTEVVLIRKLRHSQGE